LTCGAFAYTSGLPNIIAGFPKIKGIIGATNSRDLLQAEQSYVKSLRREGLDVSPDEEDMNAGGGNSKEAFLKMVEAAWKAAVAEAKAMVQKLETKDHRNPYRPFNPMRVVFVMDIAPGYFKAFPELK